MASSLQSKSWLKRALTLIYMVFVSQLVLGQYWSGEVSWLYGQDDFIEPLEDYRQFRKTKDTFMLGRDAVIIEEYYILIAGSFTTSMVGRHILSMEDSVTRYFDDEVDSFVVMYDYTLQVGDTLVSFCPALGGNALFRIMSIGTTEVYGEDRAFQIVEPIDFGCSLGAYGGGGLDGAIIDGIGSFEYLFPRPGFVDPPPGGVLLCYYQENMPYPPGATQCDIIVSSREVPDTPGVRIYPSPSSGMVYVEGEQVLDVRVYSPGGALILRQGSNVVDLNGVENGVYIISVVTTAGVVSNKIVKTSAD